MIYFDTDVLIHYLIEQDSAKHQQAIRLYQEVSENEQFFISFLCLQEVAFVLAKLKIDPVKIDSMINDLRLQTHVNYGADEFLRGKELAREIGFQNISDCLHTAIAETHCQELYTFNKSDFKHIQQHTKLKITIL